MTTHEDRYEGFKDYNPEKGTVRRFDREECKWVRLPLDEVPDSVIRERRS